MEGAGRASVLLARRRPALGADWCRSSQGRDACQLSVGHTFLVVDVDLAYVVDTPFGALSRTAARRSECQRSRHQSMRRDDRCKTAIRVLSVASRDPVLPSVVQPKPTAATSFYVSVVLRSNFVTVVAAVVVVVVVVASCRSIRSSDAATALDLRFESEKSHETGWNSLTMFSGLRFPCDFLRRMGRGHLHTHRHTQLGTHSQHPRSFAFTESASESPHVKRHLLEPRVGNRPKAS